MRVRISTTVDAALLKKSRALAKTVDSKLIDRALQALVREFEAHAELRALEVYPYDEDPDLAWTAREAPPLPYDGDVPKAVLELAKKRRRKR